MRVDGVVLDVDGVLVDVEHSYRRAIRDTVAHLCETDLPDGTIQALKNAGGFNNDWTLTDAAVLYVLARRADLDCSIQAFAERVSARGGGLAAARAVIEAACADPASIEAAWSPADVRSVFQSLYLGADLYRDLEGGEPAVRSPGYINDEPTLIDAETIEALERDWAVGVFTGRPAREAAIALDRVGIDVPEAHRVTMDDELPGKPDPTGLITLADRLACDSVAFVGDTLDDVRTARAAGERDERRFLGIGVLSGGLDGAEGRRRFEEAGADAVFPTVNAVPSWLADGS